MPTTEEEFRMLEARDYARRMAEGLDPHAGPTSCYTSDMEDFAGKSKGSFVPPQRLLIRELSARLKARQEQNGGT